MNAAINREYLANREAQSGQYFNEMSALGNAFDLRGFQQRGANMASMLGVLGGNEYSGQRFHARTPHATGVTYNGDPFHYEFFDVGVPQGGGLFDKLKASTVERGRDIVSDHDRWFKELNAFDTEGFTKKELELYRDLARPEEIRRGDELNTTLFGQGRLGTTGGAGELGTFQQALGLADKQRILDSITGGRQEQSRLHGLAFNPFYGNYLQTMQDIDQQKTSALQNLYTNFYGSQDQTLANRQQREMGILNDKLAQFNNYTGQYLDIAREGQAGQMAGMQQRAAAQQGMWNNIGQMGIGFGTAAMMNPGYNGLFGR
ncbi:MAG: hypothetical protein ACREYE_23545 [Gammaproteobacteria bacterium]